MDDRQHDREMRHIKWVGSSILFFGASLMLFLLIYCWQENGKAEDGEYKSLMDLNRHFSYIVELPYGLQEETGLKFRISGGTLAEISNEHFVMKVAYAPSPEADILGLYETCDEDLWFEGPKGEIFRYRVGNPTYPNCTLLNFMGGDNYTEGILLGAKIEPATAFEFMGLVEGDYKLRETPQVESEDGLMWFSEDVDGWTVRWALPSIESVNGIGTVYWKDLSCEGIADTVFISLGETRVLLISVDAATGEFIVDMPEDNPFESETESYTEFEALKENLESIKKSITTTAR